MYVQLCIVSLESTVGVLKRDLLLLGASAYGISISQDSFIRFMKTLVKALYCRIMLNVKPMKSPYARDGP